MMVKIKKFVMKRKFNHYQKMYEKCEQKWFVCIEKQKFDIAEDWRDKMTEYMLMQNVIISKLIWIES